MPFSIHRDLASVQAYENLKVDGDRLLEESDLYPYTIEIRPATKLEEKALAGEGLSPVADSGDNFVPDTQRMVVYCGETAENPLLEELESDPGRCAHSLVERLAQHLQEHGG